MNGTDLDDLLMSHIIFDDSPAEFDERQIGREFDLPRAQVRASLSRLVENGVITRAPRVGTIPAQSWRRHDLMRPMNNALIRGSNAARTFRVLSIESVRTVGALSAQLGVASGTTLTRIERLSLTSDSIIDAWTVWSTHSYEEYRAREESLQSKEWSDIVGDMTRLDAVHVRRASSTVRASQTDAALLAVEPGVPLNFTDVTVSAPTGELIARCFTRALSRRSVNVSETVVRLDEGGSTMNL